MRYRSFFIRSSGAVAAALAFAIASVPAASASDLEAAKRAVQSMSNDDLRAEYQRRFDARGRKPSSKTTLSRDASPSISSIDDATLIEATRFNGRMIYGADDREDWFEIKEESVKSLARASVAMFYASGTTTSGKQISLKTTPLGKAHDMWRQPLDLCADQKFATQPTAAFCSGTLVRADIVLTAGHCMSEVTKDTASPPVTAVRFVFGYRMEKADQATTKIPAEQVFSGKEVLGGEKGATRDWALVRLDRPVPAEIAKPVTDWDATPVQKGQSVFVIGYPSGIPLKYAPGAEVRETSNPGFFVSDLDTFGGNSGSGVFDQKTKKLLGVLVRGDADYVENKTAKCMQVNVCPTPAGCRGEDVTRLSVVPKL